MHERATSSIVGNVMTALRVVTRKGINSEVDFSKKGLEIEKYFLCMYLTYIADCGLEIFTDGQ